MLNGKRLAGNGGWRQLAPLVPLALFAGAFTISATDDPSVAVTALEQSAQGPKPHPVVVPRQAVTDPANLPVPGTVGNGVLSRASPRRAGR